VAYPSPYYPYGQPVVPRGNGFGVTALVLGLVGLLVFSWFPVVNLFTGLPLGLMAIIFGLVGLGKARSRSGAGVGTGGFGLVLGIATILVVVLVNVWLVNFFSDLSQSDFLEEPLIEACASDGTYTEQECADMLEST
jgi:uncharacterized membrane protein